MRTRLCLLVSVLSLLAASSSAQIITTIAGGGPVDGLVATDVGVGQVAGVAFDGQGNSWT